MTLTRIDFPTLARGMDTYAPPGSMDPKAGPPQPLWRDLNNLRPHDGELRRREGVVVSAIVAPTFLDSEAHKVAWFGLVAPSQTLGLRYLLVTTRDIFLSSDGATWTCLTPRYEVGTVSITNGTATLTGVGTLWLTRRIASGQAVELPRGSGSWYQISAVNSDTSITLTTNYTGTTLSGANYSIRRTFGTSGKPDVALNRVYVKTLNGDIYIGGAVAHGEYLGVGATVADIGVIRIDGGADHFVTPSSISPVTDVTYLVSGATEIVAGIDYLSYNGADAFGMTILADGRIVLGIAWANAASGISGDRRVIFSSHLNHAVWTTTPAGFVDVVECQSSMSALIGGTRGVSLHCLDGIVVGQLTDRDDEPLAFRPSDATVGALSPSLVQRVPGGRAVPPGEMYLGSDLNLYVFNGGSSTLLDVGIRKLLINPDGATGPQTKDAVADGFSWVDPYRNEFAILFPIPEATREIRVSCDTGVAWRGTYPAALTWAASAAHYSILERSSLTGYVCTKRFDRNAAATNLIYDLREQVTTDTIPETTANSPVTGGIYAESDVFTDPSRVWAVSSVEIYGFSVATSATENLTLQIIRDGTAETVGPVSFAATQAGERVARFYPSAQSGRAIAIRIRSDNGNAFAFRLTRMTVWLADVGEAKAA